MEGKTRSSPIKDNLSIRLATPIDFKDLRSFSCGVEELDNFFHHEVEECVSRHYLAAYVGVTNSGAIAAAFTLMNDALMIVSQSEKDDFIDDLRLEQNEDTADFLNRQTSYPAINIGHLGVAVDHQENGIGSMIIDLVAETYSQFTQAGCQFITVDAINNHQTTKFYYKNLFLFQTNSDAASLTRRMYRIL